MENELPTGKKMRNSRRYKFGKNRLERVAAVDEDQDVKGVLQKRAASSDGRRWNDGIF